MSFNHFFLRFNLVGNAPLFPPSLFLNLSPVSAQIFHEVYSLKNVSELHKFRWLRGSNFAKYSVVKFQPSSLAISLGRNSKLLFFLFFSSVYTWGSKPLQERASFSFPIQNVMILWRCMDSRLERMKKKERKIRSQKLNHSSLPPLTIRITRPTLSLLESINIFILSSSNL